MICFNSSAMDQAISHACLEGDLLGVSLFMSNRTLHRAHI